MKAVVYDKAVPGALELRELEKPVPKDGEVLVRIHAVSVNAADYRSMRMGLIPKRKIFGADIAGRVEAVGKNVGRFAAGDDVLGDISSFGFGGFAQYVAVSETALVRKPDGITFETAAALPMASVTALQALRSNGGIQPGHKVLIVGAGGGVGTFAVQLAKHLGAEVTAVCGTGNTELMRTLGADRVIDYSREDFAVSENRYDLVLAVNGGRPLSVYRRALRPGGIAVVVGGTLSQAIKAMLLGPVMSFGSRKIRILAAKPSIEDLELIIKLVEDGSIRTVIDKRYGLSETAEAVRYIGEGHARGKVIINIV